MATDKIDLNNLDKSDWKTYRFDEIAQNISERVDPNNTDLEVYIGLEHIDSESLHIKRHGTPDDVNGTKLKFYKGDIIFGRRRAYQRKAGIATCDGFCSAHALVLRANPDVIDPELFPFFMHSDLFMNRAVDISVGSLSPTINWGTLKHQEFLIPPKETQNNLAKILIAQNLLLQKKLQLFNNLNTLKSSLQKELYCLKDRVMLKEYASIIGGFAFPSHSFTNSGTPVIKIKNIVKGKVLVESTNNRIDENQFTNIERFKLVEGDLLIAMTGATLGKLGVVQKEFSGSYLNQRVGKFQLEENMSESFIYGVCDSKYFLRELNKYIGEGAQGNISAEDLSKCLVPKVNIEESKVYGRKFDEISSTKNNLSKEIAVLKSLSRSLIERVF